MGGRASTADIKESAGWDKTHAVGSYLTGPVLSTISVVAGHAENTFVMRRGRVSIPKELDDIVLPWVVHDLAAVTKVRFEGSQEARVPPELNAD